MPQPTFAIACEYGLTVRRGNRTTKARFGDGYEQVSPDGLNTDIREYTIDTAPISDEAAIALDGQLASLNGDFFYSQFFMDSGLFKYRLEPNAWQWRVVGPNSNVFSFTVRRIYDTRS
jgi:phage-related protein